ncbi:MAG: cohesin domain-containing protein [Bryobacteraceae bacterium]
MNQLAATLTVLAMVLGAPAEAGNRKGDRLLNEGKKAEARGDLDTALDYYERALAADPTDASYMLHMRRARFAAAQRHVDLGQKLRAEGKLEEALAEFRKAFVIDPSSGIAEQELRRTNRMIERDKKEKAKPGEEGEDRGLTDADRARKEALERAARMLEAPELKPATRRVAGLKIVNQTARVMYETLGKLAGLNVLFDADFQDTRRYTLDLNQLTLDEALEYVSLVTKTYYKPLSQNTIFVTQDNPTKRRDYEEHVTRVFYLQNVYSAQEMTEIQTAMRSVTDLRKVFPLNTQFAIVARGTRDQIALAEKVLLDLDKPKPEVVVDVLVMEANRTRARDLALTPLSAGKPGLGSPVSFTGGGTSGAVPLNQVRDLGAGDWSVVLPSFLVQALLSDRQTRVLTTPQVRAVDGQKATLRLGDRVPYASGSFAPGAVVGGGGLSPFVQTQFQFAEVGVNIDMTPRIHGDEVSLEVELEISNIRERIDLGGLSQPVIGQRRVKHVIRAREGEVTLIGGLMQATVSRVRSGVPGLMNIPILGRLFSSENLENANSDLLVALVPRVVRAPEITAESLRAVASGAETIYRVNFAREEDEAQEAEAPARQPGEPVRTPLVPGTAAPRPQPAPPPAGHAPPPAPEAAPAKPAETPAAEEPAAAQGPRLSWQPASQEAALNSTVTVRLQVENVNELFSAPLRIRFEPRVLRLLDVQRGPFLAGDGAQVNFSDTRDDATGLVIVNMNRLPGSGGITGSGVLLELKFQAVGRGEGSIRLEDVTLRDAKLEAMPAGAPSAVIRVP